MRDRGDDYRFHVYIKTMQSCSSMFDTSWQSFQRQDGQEVHAISCFLSEADEIYICVSHTRKWRHPCKLQTIISRSGEASSIQHYMRKWVSDLRHVMQWFSPFSTRIKSDHHGITEMLLKVVLDNMPPIIRGKIVSLDLLFQKYWSIWFIYRLQFEI